MIHAVTVANSIQVKNNSERCKHADHPWHRWWLLPQKNLHSLLFRLELDILNLWENLANPKRESTERTSCDLFPFRASYVPIRTRQTWSQTCPFAVNAAWVWTLDPVPGDPLSLHFERCTYGAWRRCNLSGCETWRRVVRQSLDRAETTLLATSRHCDPASCWSCWELAREDGLLFHHISSRGKVS